MSCDSKGVSDFSALQDDLKTAKDSEVSELERILSVARSRGVRMG